MSPRCRLLFALVLLPALACGCGGEDRTAGIRNEGSDTMVNIAEAWAEQYHREHPQLRIQVLGGGSGVGIASLIDGNCDLANTSRKMKKDEIEAARKQQGVEPREFVVGYDALAIYVHPRNPLESISLEELARFTAKRARSRTGRSLACPKALGADKITRINRQSGSGTYAYFREAVLGKGKDLKLASVNANGSKDAVRLVSRTPSAIGYSGMGYVTPEVKTLRVSRRRGEPAIAPTVENARNGSYPITRPLQIYAIGEPAGQVKEYLDWILAPEGQKIVLELGYVPVGLREAASASQE